VAHLRDSWASGPRTSTAALVDRVLPPGTAAQLDRFDRVQLEDVLIVCRRSSSLSAAGRVLFDRSRERKKIANDADRLRKYLARFDLDWSDLKERLR
jgi:transcriptional regulatory protein RtcR